MKNVRILVALSAVVWGATSVFAQSQPKVEQGAALFVAQKCSLCHSAAGKGNPKGSLDAAGANQKADEIRQWILDPEGMRAKTRATRMPAMKRATLSTDQVDALVAFITSLKSTAAAADAEK
jgi:mono/diheme cytochrome c family protein